MGKERLSRRNAWVRLYGGPISSLQGLIELFVDCHTDYSTGAPSWETGQQLFHSRPTFVTITPKSLPKKLVGFFLKKETNKQSMTKKKSTLKTFQKRSPYLKPLNLIMTECGNKYYVILEDLLSYQVH